MEGKRIVLGITGGIAAYKAAILASALTKRGAQVTTVMTRGATQFITPLTLQSLTRQPVYVDVFEERNPARITHIELADEADVIVVAPATADAIARIAHGFGDDMLTALLLATRAPVVVAPAMNVHMYENRIVKKNIELLVEAGYKIAEPGVGPLACGYNGKGRLMEPDELLEYIEMVLTDKPLLGEHVLVTAGPTRERIDPVRYLTNDSTGTMGYALAQMAWRMGAQVTLISGPVDKPPLMGVERIFVTSAAEMYNAVMSHLPMSTIVIKAAAVADYRPEFESDKKLKKQDDALLHLTLAQNPDILKAIKERRNAACFVVGFAAETHNPDYYARKKLEEKGLDLLVLNDVLEPGAGFGTTTNRVSLYYPDGSVQQLPLAPKLDVARDILLAIAEQKKGKVIRNREHSQSEDASL
ncbi:bifunctional phosphopantothenoylcysteine decarboxylase/phosphopantothenate--cysteine ligase CoaBC [Sulfoacidibacillus thermotolerans]|uniref:Coenzyme A biosynthesis bifunctional protein CoaBC n=1 Tax=Sulfoacidibacillus thermotolerans TaxID=1765684 RepID=A0A2U3D7S6_SULT2|nr:bifunctional phosphopantothenoylcysteine decarboxylase/phosphopantothenate--cysteine ligase CoaBC [Sulfoacidibacillus thermotolerans]PWI57334.1 bifunctional 4'-phosphopantothenoylcysteine decarboxylase/phosphopantothenoylcysteine synthetase [Sulfoacidibacillus thermotolerans]